MSLILGFLWSGHVMAIEEPKYETLLTDGPYEVRKYTPILVAETIAEGDMSEASNKGFRLIADFIFGNNQATGSSGNEKIAMTAPVSVEAQSDDLNIQIAKQWRISFVMPSQYTLATIPKPKNSAVNLREIAAKYFVVYRYSGFNSDSRVQSKTEETIKWAIKKDLKIIGKPQLSRYDPPWTLPMFRRNEIMVEIADPQIFLQQNK